MIQHRSRLFCFMSIGASQYVVLQTDLCLTNMEFMRYPNRLTAPNGRCVCLSRLVTISENGMSERKGCVPR